jgi:undecaprenyl-diphosphatase
MSGATLDRNTFEEDPTGSSRSGIEPAVDALRKAADERPDATPSRRRWDGRWPVRKHEIGQLLVALACVIGVFSLLGLMYTDWFAPNAITRLDDRIAEAAADNRTELLTDAVPWVAFPADTYTKITISALICLFFLWRWRRWYEAVYVALPLVFEACAFITTTYIVKRDRPEVERLLDSQVATSYPSGHVAAATVYAAVAVIVFRHTRAAWARAAAVLIAVITPLAVAWARVYQGMHFFTDVLAGILLGGASLIVTHHVLKPHEPDDLEPLVGHRSAAATDSVSTVT